MKYVIGIDAGTTCFKAGLYDSKLNMIAQAAEEYRLLYPRDGFVEFVPQQYWDIFCRLTHQLLRESKVSSDKIVGLSICSQGETMILLDKNDTPLCNAIVWTDARATVQAEELADKIGPEEVIHVTGQRELTGTWPVTKLLWFRETHPEIFDRISHVLLLEDYLIYRLTGVYATDRSLSSSTVYMDIRKGCWWKKMLELIGLPATAFPTLYDSGQPIAAISPAGAEASGLSICTTVAAGALDQASGMLGAGNIKKGMVTETTGTCLAVCTNIGEFSDSYDDGLLPIHYGLSADRFYSIYWSAAAGSIYRWVRDQFYRDITPKKQFRQMDAEAAKVLPGCSGLMMMPYPSGLNYPFANENAKGAFSGFSLSHTRGHFARSVLESIAFLLRQSIEEIEQNGLMVNEIYSLGGGSTSPLWNQIKADVTGKRIFVPDESEITCRGAATMAAIGAGIYQNAEDAVSTTLKIKKIYEPQQSELYHSIYQTFLTQAKHYYQQYR